MLQACSSVTSPSAALGAFASAGLVLWKKSARGLCATLQVDTGLEHSQYPYVLSLRLNFEGHLWGDGGGN